MTNTNNSPSPKQYSFDKRIQILKALAKYGAITVPILAAEAYDHISTDSAQRKTRAQLQRLREAGLVLTKTTGIFGGIYATLSLKGARSLAEHGVEAKTGKDDEVSNHRSLSNLALIQLSKLGPELLIFSEKEILSDRAPVKYVGGKCADGLALKPNNKMIWIEVEACRRGGRDLLSLAEWIIRNRNDPRIEEFLFVISPMAGHFAKRLASAFKKFTTNDDILDKLFARVRFTSTTGISSRASGETRHGMFWYDIDSDQFISDYGEWWKA